MVNSSCATSCVFTSCLHVCRSLPRCSSTWCRKNVEMLERQLPPGRCATTARRRRSVSFAKMTARRRRRRRSSTVDDGNHRLVTLKRSYSDATDICLNYHCGKKDDRTVYEYIECAIENKCGFVWWTGRGRKQFRFNVYRMSVKDLRYPALQTY